MNNRNNNRFYSYAKVLMDGIPGYMRDISREGFKYVTIMPFPVKEGEEHMVQVIPENDSFGKFSLKGEIRWIKTDKEGFQVCGIRILEYTTPEGDSIYRRMTQQFAP